MRKISHSKVSPGLCYAPGIGPQADSHIAGEEWIYWFGKRNMIFEVYTALASRVGVSALWKAREIPMLLVKTPL